MIKTTMEQAYLIGFQRAAAEYGLEKQAFTLLEAALPTAGGLVGAHYAPKDQVGRGFGGGAIGGVAGGLGGAISVPMLAALLGVKNPKTIGQLALLGGAGGALGGGYLTRDLFTKRR